MEFSEASRSSFYQRTLRGFSGTARPDAGLRMAPMIDVIFLLLTFFVLTARFRLPEAFVPLQLPKAGPSEQPQLVEPLILEMIATGEQCRIRIASEQEVVLSSQAPQTGLAALADAVEQVCRRQRRRVDDPVELICGDQVPWDSVVKVYDLLRVLGLNQITFVMTEADEGHAE